MRERIKQKKVAENTKRRMKAIELIVANKGKHKGESLVQAGYSDKYATNPNQFLKTDAVQRELDFLKYEQTKIKERMEKTRNKARYKELTDTYVNFKKLGQLIGGEATERIAITPEERKDVDDAFLNL